MLSSAKCANSMQQKISRSTIIDAPIERVWSILRDFNGHAKWHSAIKQSHIESHQRADQVGCVRSFTLHDGNHAQERLLSLDDKSYKLSYCIVRATLPLERYVAHIALKPVTDGRRTFWHWESTFSAPPGLEQELRELVGEHIYSAGFANFRKYLESSSDISADSSGTAPSTLAAQTLATRRIVVSHYGSADQLVGIDSHAASPAAGEIRIKQRAVGVNYLDVYLRKGWIPAMLAEGATPGSEAAGTVIDVGPGVTHVLPGDRVAYLYANQGAYATARTVPADRVIRVPASVEDDLAAATLLKGITADYLIHDLGRIQNGTRLLVHAAAGGVGALVCSWAKSKGAIVIGTVSSDSKARIARDYGCEHVIVTSEYKFAGVVKSIVGAVDVVVDGLGAAAMEENLAALAQRGHWISIGQATGAINKLDPHALVAKSITFSSPVVFDYAATQLELAMRANRVWHAIENRQLRKPMIERHSLESAARAHERLESRASVGSLVLIT
jgi:NADPH:quinone reductase